jgi:hypothetical protein
MTKPPDGSPNCFQILGRLPRSQSAPVCAGQPDAPSMDSVEDTGILQQQNQVRKRLRSDILGRFPNSPKTVQPPQTACAVTAQG